MTLGDSPGLERRPNGAWVLRIGVSGRARRQPLSKRIIRYWELGFYAGSAACATGKSATTSAGAELLAKIRRWSIRTWLMIVVAVVGGALIVITTHNGQAPAKYGGVPIPGKRVLQLPKGKVIISFSGFTGGGTANGSGIAVPNDLGVSIYPVNPRVPPAPIHSKTGSVQPNGDYMTAPVWSVEVPESAAYQ